MVPSAMELYQVVSLALGALGIVCTWAFARLRHQNERKTLAIACAKESRDHLPIQLNYIQGFAKNTGGRRLLAFQVQVENPSSLAVEIPTVGLLIRQSTAQAPTIHLENRELKRGWDRNDGQLLSFPLRLEPRTTNKGWLTFEEEKSLFHGLEVDSYHVYMKDVTAHEIGFDAFLLHEKSSR